MNCVKRSMLVCMLAIALTTLLTAAVAEAAGLTSGKWSIVKSPNAGSDVNELLGVAAVSTTNVWAVGYYTKNGGAQTLIEHWNGTSWQVVSSPNVAGSSGSGLVSVVAVSATNVWAAGGYANSRGVGQTLIEHWNGTSWQVVSSPNVAGSDTNSLYGVAAVSAHDIWAVGFYSPTPTGAALTLIEHWNGTSWQVVSSPNVGSRDNFLLGVTRVPSSSSLWAVGLYIDSSGSSKTLTEFSG